MADDREDETAQKSTSKRKLLFVLFLILLVAAALAIGITLNLTLKDDDSTSPLNVTSPVTAKYLVDCHPDKDPNKTRCEDRGCTWVERGDGDQKAACTFPDLYGYIMVGDPEDIPKGVKVRLLRFATPALYGMEPYSNLTVVAEFHTDKRLRIKIYPTEAQQFEIPEEALNITSPPAAAENETRLYDVAFHSDPLFGFTVTRRSTNTTIFNTSLPGMAFYPQFLQISTLLPNTYVYGFGEHRHETFRHDFNYRKWSIFTRDVGPDNNWNLYGAHPVYMNVEDDGKANMVFLKNSNAMEIFLQPDPSLTFRTIGGVLDFYFFLGDSPGDAVSLYTEAIGRPVLPPYWALGYQLSRWGYTNLTDMEMVISRTRAAQIPYDVQWADIDTLFKKYVFTVDKELWSGLPAVVDDLHKKHQHFVIILDPGVGANQTIIEEAKNNSNGYDILNDGEAAHVFVKAANGSTLLGEVWPGITAYPDYTIGEGSFLDWYEKYVNFYRNNEGIKVDALWIDMNEPSSFVPGSVDGCNRTLWDYPPYVPNILGAENDGRMYDKTLCMTSQHAWGRHYDVHSLYAHAMAMRTNQVLQRVFPDKRPWTMTRSSFAGTGHYATKWMGDNQARWPALHWSIIGIMEFSMFGFAFNGADICGFWYETTYEMCIRWHQLGAFYPFARNHNGKGDPPTIFKHQDPAAFDQRFIDIIKRPLMTRYRLLPYVYSLLYKAHLYGETVMRPLMFDFPTDLRARDVDRQFLLGPALLVSPVLEAGVTSVEAYFPEARWYEYGTGEEVTSVGQNLTLDTPLDKFNLHVRGGQVIPWQTPSLTTHESRNNSMGLIVALNETWRAEGDLYLDDGESNVKDTSYSHVSFIMDKAGELHLIPNKTDYNDTAFLKFETLEIYGLPIPPKTVRVDDKEHSRDNIRYYNQVVQIINLSLGVLEDHVITWMVY